MRHNRDDYYNPRIVEESLQGVPQNYNGQQRTRPRRMEIFFHLAKTGRLIKALMLDRRVSIWRKAFFFGAIGGLLFILLSPDLLNETIMSTVLPLADTGLVFPPPPRFIFLPFPTPILTLFLFV